MLNVTKVNLWSAPVENRPGGLLAALEPLVKAGADLELMVARRSDNDRDDGLVLLSPVHGQRQEAAAEQLGFRRNENIFCLRLEGPDEPGYAYRILYALAADRLNLKEVSAASLNNQFVMFVAFDNAADADNAMVRLQRQL